MAMMMMRMKMLMVKGTHKHIFTCLKEVLAEAQEGVMYKKSASTSRSSIRRRPMYIL